MVTRRTLIAAGAASAAGLPALAQEAFRSQDVQRGRATAPVRLNGQGPFQFVVDTAANSSVVSSDLVDRLALPSIGSFGMHTLIAREVVPAVRLDRLESGSLDARGVTVAVGQRAAIAGLDGLLGCDLLARSRVVLNFRGGQSLRIARSSAPPRGLPNRVDSSTPIVIRGERRFGNLLAAPARIGASAVTAIIDTGAEGTILNRAAARAGRATPLTLPDGQSSWRIQSPTGQVTVGDAMVLPFLHFGQASVVNIPVAVGDFHTFSLWGLIDQPAMLLGLDVFQLFDSIHIDLGRSELTLRM